MKTLLTMFFAAFFIFSCVSSPTPQVQQAPQEVLIKIQGVDTVKVEEEGDGVLRGMEVNNPNGELSMLTFILKGKAYTKLFSGLGVGDVTHFWNDICVLDSMGIRDMDLFINSPGGSAFAGLALSDEIKRAQHKGFKITAYASGIIASAAVPVFAVCDYRIAAASTLFMLHEASIFKWAGVESAGDIEAQTKMMRILSDRYTGLLADRTPAKYDAGFWEKTCKATTWFDAEEAKRWGIVDKIR